MVHCFCPKKKKTLVISKQDIFIVLFCLFFSKKHICDLKTWYFKILDIVKIFKQRDCTFSNRTKKLISILDHLRCISKTHGCFPCYPLTIDYFACCPHIILSLRWRLDVYLKNTRLKEWVTKWIISPNMFPFITHIDYSNI